MDPFAKSPRTSRDAEVEFHISEIFFSRTDPRGKILAGNGVFQRISQYAWDELLGIPHNVVRHADMPRGVFWLLWDRLRKGLATGAYVKNRAKDGRSYWVYAVITPIVGGYLSVRIKPSSEVFSTIENEYSSLLGTETADALMPAQSGKILIARLQSLGFDDYAAFMTKALVAEFNCRERSLQRTDNRSMENVQALMDSADSLIKAASGLAEGYRGHQFVPLNLTVQAGRLGHAGSAIGAISDNFSLVSEEIREALKSFGRGAARVAKAIGEGAFLLATARIQQEAVVHFQREAKPGEIDHGQEMDLLTGQQQSYQIEALNKLRSIEQEIERFHQQTSQMKRLASALSAIRVMGKVESGRLCVDVLEDLITDLEAFQQAVAAGLADIVSINQGLRIHAAELLCVASNDLRLSV